MHPVLLPSRIVSQCPMAASVAVSANDAVDVLREVGCDRLITLTALEMRMAVVLLRISNSGRLAQQWAEMVLTRKHRWKPGLALEVTAATLRDWSSHYAADPLVLRCLSDPACDTRSVLHIFTVESLLAAHVTELTLRGLIVPSSYLMKKYITWLQFLPGSARVVERETMMRRRGSAAKKWCARFRDAWRLSWGTAPLPHMLYESAMQRRTAIWWRWVLHVLLLRRSEGIVVVLNMDETMLSGVKRAKRGVTSCSAAVADPVAPRRERGMLRTSLLATICSDAEVQPHLPQIRLPRGDGRAAPSRPVLRSFADAGRPQVAWHGSGGWVTTRVLVWYLRVLRRSVQSVRPGARLVLLLDCCPSHMAQETLAAARRTGVDLIFVPSRMTFMLQPLDTHVFAVLKGRIRELEFEARAAAESGTVSPLDRVRLHGRAVDEILVHRDWSQTMVRGGCTGDASALRPAIAELLLHQCGAPMMPSTADLAEVLQVPVARAAAMRAALLPVPLLRAPVEVPADIRGAAAGYGAAEAAAGVAPARRPVMVLSPWARLPPAPAADRSGVNLWSPAPRRPEAGHG